MGVGNKGYLDFDMHPILIAEINAIKELNNKIEEQQKQIEEQQKTISNLKSDNDSVQKRMLRLEELISPEANME